MCTPDRRVLRASLLAPQEAGLTLTISTLADQPEPESGPTGDPPSHLPPLGRSHSLPIDDSEGSTSGTETAAPAQWVRP